MRVQAVCLLLPLLSALPACADEEQTSAAFPTQAVGPSGLPPPLYVSTSAGPCTDDDATGCEARCASGDDDACTRMRLAWRAAAPAQPAAPAAEVAATAPVQVNTPRGAVQFFGPVGTVHIDPGQSR
jgi:hypothetical protein